MNIDFMERSNETIDAINSFYAAAGYNGRATDEDKVFLAKSGEKILGAVRITKENRSPILRGMFIHPDHRGSRIGLNLLKILPEYLNSFREPCYAIPHDHLLNFYGKIGFTEVMPDEVPEFLKERFMEYCNRGLRVSLIKRNPNE
jgi:N-acetylglutamate synthase-like GNAT family acetyltransferase